LRFLNLLIKVFSYNILPDKHPNNPYGAAAAIAQARFDAEQVRNIPQTLAALPDVIKAQGELTRNLPPPTQPSRA
jgi:hypothetical protein